MAYFPWLGWQRPSAWPSGPDRVWPGQKRGLENRSTVRPLVTDHMGQQTLYHRPHWPHGENALPQPTHWKVDLGEEA